MKICRVSSIAIVVGFASTAASAQFVKGNEAVQTRPNGSKRVTLPTQPSIKLATPCPANKEGCAGGGWKMVETDDGLQECTEFYARPGTCRASTYGSQKLTRVWIVFSHGAWRQCQLPDLSKTCVSMSDLPVRAVQ